MFLNLRFDDTRSEWPCDKFMNCRTMHRNLLPLLNMHGFKQDNLPSQELDIPFGRPAISPAEITSGEVSPSSLDEVAGPGASSQQASATCAEPASVISAAAAPSAPRPSPRAASVAGSSTASTADRQNGSVGGGGGGASPGGSMDLVMQRSRSLTVRTAPSEAQGDDSPIVWCVRPRHRA